MEADDVVASYRARKVVCEMLHDRGCVMDGDAENSLRAMHDEPLGLFRKNHGHDPLGWRIRALQGGKKLQVKCVADLGAERRDEVMELVKIHGVQILVLLVKNQMKKRQREDIVKEAQKYYCEIQPFQLEQMQFNISRNFMVPKHSVLSEQQKKEMLQHFMITEDKLPVILREDAMARYLGLEPG